jgi:hypothetical protein
VTARELEEYDREHPMPVPEPRCGQVWMRIKTGQERMIIGFDREDRPIMVQHEVHQLCGVCPEPDWRMSSLLLSGPGSPWAPPDWEPLKEDT